MKIKSILSIFITLFWSLYLSGCNKTEDNTVNEPPLIELAAEPLMINFESSGGQQNLSISSNSSWRIDFSGISWCRPSVQTTIGNASITITADANPDTEERSAEFVLSAKDAEDVIVSLVQSGKEPKPVRPDQPLYKDPDPTGMRDLTSFEFAGMMTLGWNLGNSLEAISVNNGIYSGSETTWGNPVVTRQFIDAVKSAGFNTLRVPVSWSHKLDQDQIISYNWLLRVEEVVNYALENDMFVKINIHWDGGWMNYPWYSQQESINQKISTLWQQIAIHFRDYDDRLLFAGTNEVHVAGDWGTPAQENVNVQNSFNQTFVNSVRATGGRNAFRHLVVQAYNTDIRHAVNFFVMPVDQIENRLIAEVHYYDPSDFALAETGNFKTLWGQPFADGDVSAWGQEEWVHEAFGMLKNLWIDKGIPVILGEYGAILRSNLTGDALKRHIESRNYYLEYITRTAIEYGVVPIYWDNGYIGNCGFGLFNRSNGEVVHADALNALLRGAGLLP